MWTPASCSVSCLSQRAALWLSGDYITSVNMLGKCYTQFYFKCLARAAHDMAESAIWRTKRSLQPFLAGQFAWAWSCSAVCWYSFQGNTENKSRGYQHFLPFPCLVPSTEKEKEKDKKKGSNNELYSYSLIRKHAFFSSNSTNWRSQFLMFHQMPKILLNCLLK